MRDKTAGGGVRGGPPVNLINRLEKYWREILDRQRFECAKGEY